MLRRFPNGYLTERYTEKLLVTARRASTEVIYGRSQ
jgi:hypothetical protein